MKRVVLFFLFGLPALAQQQVTPDDFDRGQERVFQKLTQAVSTPCCTNGIPVAFHDSGMANFVRGEIIKWIRAGKSQGQIRAELEAMRLGPDRDMPLIFTEPDNKLVSLLTWAVAPATLGAGFLIIFLLVLKRQHGPSKLSDDELFERYRHDILEKARDA